MCGELHVCIPAVASKGLLYDAILCNLVVSLIPWYTRWDYLHHATFCCAL